MALPNNRITNLFIVVVCVGLMAFALFSEMVLGLHPCPLCMTQRLFVILIGVFALIAFLHNPSQLGRRIYASLGIVAAILGGSVAGRHVWLQNLPEDQVPACGPGLDYILENFPLSEGFVILMRGDGNCADVVWRFLGLSMPTWVIVAFAGLLVVNIWQLIRRT